ncbi:MAG: FAD:protein FMN transferase [Pseudomonadota bacterium]
MKNIFHFEAMTTPCEVVIYLPNKEEAAKVAKEILIMTKALEKKYNYFDEMSVVSQINSRELQVIDMQTKDLLQRAKSFYTQTNGLFDITVATLKPMFKLDTLDEVQSYKECYTPYVGCDHFEIKKGKIVFDNPFTKIDLGGLVKEYAVDKAVEILKKRKIKSALVNFGGDLYALGKKPDGEAFKIGIKNPINPAVNLMYVDLCDAALTTSADYERHYRIQERQFSHIISKQEQSRKLLSATVISHSAVISGVFSTALMIESSLKIPYQTFTITDTLDVVTRNVVSIR